VDSFTPWPLYSQGKAPSTHCIGGWVGPRAGLDTVEGTQSPPGIEPRSPDHPARSVSSCV